MKKAVKKAIDKILSLVMAIVIIFIAAMMIGKSLPAWSTIALVWSGWVLLILGILALFNAFIGLFK